jgi:hypothetical protein
LDDALRFSMRENYFALLQMDEFPSRQSTAGSENDNSNIKQILYIYIYIYIQFEKIIESISLRVIDV